jgi:hypothetical protein
MDPQGEGQAGGLEQEHEHGLTLDELQQEHPRAMFATIGVARAMDLLAAAWEYAPEREHPKDMRQRLGHEPFLKALGEAWEKENAPMLHWLRGPQGVS